MTDKCPECDKDISILLQSNAFNCTTNSTITINECLFKSTVKKYKCSNPKCWVVKITKTWE